MNFKTLEPPRIKLRHMGLLSGEIGIGRGMNGGGIYLKVGTRIIGLQTSEDFTEWPYPILVRKLPKGSIINLIAR